MIQAVPRSMIQNLFQAFEKLPQRVLFKYKLEVKAIKKTLLVNNGCILFLFSINFFSLGDKEKKKE